MKHLAWVTAVILFTGLLLTTLWRVAQAFISASVVLLPVATA